MNDIGTRLSTLWVVVMFNMVFADILTFITPGKLQELWAGQAGVTHHSGASAGVRDTHRDPDRDDLRVAHPEAGGQPLGEHRGGGDHHRVRRRRRVADASTTCSSRP